MYILYTSLQHYFRILRSCGSVLQLFSASVTPCVLMHWVKNKSNWSCATCHCLITTPTKFFSDEFQKLSMSFSDLTERNGLGYSQLPVTMYDMSYSQFICLFAQASFKLEKYRATPKKCHENKNKRHYKCKTAIQKTKYRQQINLSYCIALRRMIPCVCRGLVFSTIS